MVGFIVTYLLANSEIQDQFKPPAETKLQERQKFHFPSVKGMSGEALIEAADLRLKMLKNSPFKQVKWRSIGSEVQGGRVVDVVVPDQNAQDIYVAFATGGLHRTSNNGQTWESLFDDQSAFGIGDIDITNDGKTIWVGTGEANHQRTSYAGTGVFKSTDSGKTWQNVGLRNSHHIAKVVIHPKNPNEVYVASAGPLYSQGGERGLYRTLDGGKTWQLILAGDDRTGCVDIDIDPKDPKRMYAMMYERDRRAWNYLESGPGSAAYRSIDGGKSWQKMSQLPSGEEMGRTAFAIAPSRPNTLYAFVDNQGYDSATGTQDEFTPGETLTVNRFMRASEEVLRTIEDATLRSFLRSNLASSVDVDTLIKGFKDKSKTKEDIKALMLERSPSVFDQDPNLAQIWRSDDYGVTWKKTRPRMGDHGGYYWNEITVHPQNPEELYTLGLLILKSTDGGASWDAIGRRNHVDHHAYWIDPKNPSRHLNGNDGGIYASFDAGNSWTHWNNLSVGQFTTIAVDDKTPYNVYGGLQDNGTMRGPSNYRPGIDDLNRWEAIGGGDGSAIAIDPRGEIVYTASQFGSHGAQNFVTNQRWSARKNPGRGEPQLRYNWISPILISPHHPDVVYLGAQRLMRSFNNGRAYEYLSDDLTKNRENGDVPHSTLTTIAESPFRFGQLYVGTDDGNVQYTPDSGLTWNLINTPQPSKWVTRVIASKFKQGRIYVSQNGYRDDDWKPYVWVSEDDGQTWKSIASNLPNNCINTVREDPTNQNILYVGSDMGVYVSVDRGGSWMPYGSGIPATPVHDLVIQEKAKEMVIASHARSAWVISVEEIYDAVADAWDKPVHEFEFNVPSGRANWPYRRASEFADPQPQERNLTLTLFVKTGGSGTWRIVDEQGREVKSGKQEFDNGYNYLSYSLLNRAGDPKALPNLNPPKTAEEALADPYAARRPDYLAIGKYKLELKWGSETFTKEFEIK